MIGSQNPTLNPYIESKQPSAQGELNLKIGDIVRIKLNAKELHTTPDIKNGIYCWTAYRDLFLGRLGKITDIWQDGSFALDITGKTIYWRPMDVELFSRPSKYHKGDTVGIKNGGRTTISNVEYIDGMYFYHCDYCYVPIAEVFLEPLTEEELKEFPAFAEPKFHKGDNVISLVTGEVHTIEDTDIQDGVWSYLIFDNEDNSIWLSESDLKPYVVEPKFKVGDFALVTDGYAKGSVITIKAINVETPISYKSDLRDDGMAQWFPESKLEPYTEPKFKVGDKVIHNHKNREVGEVVAYFPDEICCYSVRFGKEYHNMAEHQLKPYTEPETKPFRVGDKVKVKGEDKVREIFRILPDGRIMFGDKGNTYSAEELKLVESEAKDNMEKNRCEKCKANAQQCANSPCQDYLLEEKELNLCELLKGCEGETLYSDLYGLEVTLIRVIQKEDLVMGQDPIVTSVGCYKSDGSYSTLKLLSAALFPSRALREKYPLDAYSAWMEWKEARKPKRWRAKQNKEFYYFLDDMLIINDIVDSYDYFCNNRYKCGNYFRTKEEAMQAAEAMRECLRKFHEKNTEK